ncbi:MAG: MSCRAMM family protein, partial [Candidatus Hodarchaeales archaeon]
DNQTTILLRYGDAYQWWLRWNDTDTPALIEDTTPPYSLDYFHVNIAKPPSSGNHTFQFNATELGTFPVTITLAQSGFQSQTFDLTFIVESNPTAISASRNGPAATVYLRYFEPYDFWLVWEDTNHTGQRIDSSSTTIIGPYTTQGPMNGVGNHTFGFAGAPVGNYQVDITLNTTGYDAILYEILFVVEDNPTTISASRNGPDATVHLRYFDSYEFWLIWEDTNHSGTLINDLIPDIIGSYTAKGPLSATGNHTFTFTGAPLGSYAVNITLAATGYDAALYQIRFVVERNPTAAENPSLQPGSIQPVLFGETFTFYFIWQDSNHSSPIVGASIEINETAVTELSALGGNYSFLFYSPAIGTYGANISLSKTGYEPMSYLLTFVVQPRPTQVPVATSSDHEIPDSVDAGDLVLGQYFWIDTNSSLSVPAGNVIAFWNETPATQASFLQSLDGDYSITIDTNEKHWGHYNLTLQFWKYGYENQSLTFSFEIKGLTVHLIMEDIPEHLVRGEDFVLEATLFRNQSSNRLMLLQEADSPVPDELILFTVVVTFDNGTQHTFTLVDPTDDDGIAHFPLSRDDTKHIKSVDEIKASYAGSTAYKPSEHSVPQSNLPSVISGATDTPFFDEIWNFVLDNLLFIIIGAIILLALGSVSGYQLWTYQITARRHRAINRKMQEIRLLRMVIIRHKDGVPLFSKSVFGVGKDVAEAIAGMSAAIGSFMEGLSAKTIEGAGHTPGSSTEFVRMEQRGLHMLQRKGDHTSVIMISEGPLGKFMEENITKLQLEVENRYSKQFARFFTNEQVPESQLKPLVYHHLYLGLLEPLHLNVRKIRAEERNLTSEERRIVRELLAHKELVPMEVLFVDSYLSHLRDRGIPEVAAAQFLLKSYQVGFIEAQSVEEAMRQRPQQ